MISWPGLVPRIIGHRGAAAMAPENTLAGLRRAAALGLAWVEVDARLTADDVPVLVHDETLARTAGTAARVRDLRAAELAGLDAGAWFGGAFAGEPVPTLADAAALADRLGLGLNVELKPDPDTVEETGAVVGRALAALAGRQPLLVSCFDPDCLDAAVKAAPDLPRALNRVRFAPDALDRARSFGACALHLGDGGATRSDLDAIAAADLVAGVFTVNDPARASRLFEAGVDYLFTDDPAALASFWRD